MRYNTEFGTDGCYDRKDIFSFFCQNADIVVIGKKHHKKPENIFLLFFLRFIIRNNCILNYVIIFCWSLAGRPNSCFSKASRIL